MRIEIPGFILASPYGSIEKPDFSHCGSEMKEHGYTTVCSHTVVVEIPDGFDPRAGMIDALKAKKKAILAEAHQQVTRIEERIQSLLAIENKG